MSKNCKKEYSMKEHFNTSNVFKEIKKLIWNLKFHADTTEIFSLMNKTLKFTVQWYLLHNKTSC